jgi:hypothetical protein
MAVAPKAKATAEPAPKKEKDPNKSTLGLNIPNELKERLMQIAQEEKRTIGAAAEWAIEKYCDASDEVKEKLHRK